VSELANQIKTEIAARGVISFAQFMGMALYHPGLGYYETDRSRVGFQGDFYTSVSTGELFGQLLAFRFAGWFAEFPAEAEDLRIVEAGAHDGKLAGDIMGWLKRHRPELFGRIQYCIIEPSAQRQAWQAEKLKEFGARVQWVGNFAELDDKVAAESTPGAQIVASPSPRPSPPGEGECSAVGRASATAGVMPSPKEKNAALYRDAATPLSHGALNGIIFSNELLDAMPVHRLGWDAAKHEWFEWGVGWDGGQFVWLKMPTLTVGLELAAQFPDALLQVLPDGYAIEVCPAAADWWREAAGVLARGRLLTMDYGFTTEEMISPSRTKGTLRAYFRHHLSDDLLINAGEQDLTAHVNFSVIQAAGEGAGLRTEGYITQPQFLTRILADAIKDPAFRDWNTSRTRQFQTLTHPEHLGRSFKVLVQGR
jgi:SAM-dependent MidA family methyltransferase